MAIKPINNDLIFVSKPSVNLPKNLQILLKDKIIRVALAILTCGFSILVQAGIQHLAKRAFMMAAYIPEAKKLELFKQQKAFLERNANHAKEVFFKTHDGALINGVQISPSKPTDKCVIFFCGMGTLYENYLENDNLITYAEQTGTNVLIFNYRGIGKSKGDPLYGKNVVEDGDAAVQFMKNQGFKEDKIALVGHSLGGGIAGQVAMMNPSSPYMGDKTFSSLKEAVRSIRGVFQSMLVPFAKWDFNTRDLWDLNHAPKILFVHKKDYMIPYLNTSLYRALKGLGFKTESKRLEKSISHEEKGYVQVYFDKALIILGLKTETKCSEKFFGKAISHQDKGHVKVYFDTEEENSALSPQEKIKRTHLSRFLHEGTSFTEFCQATNQLFKVNSNYSRVEVS